jgi:hypothetical protein
MFTVNHLRSERHQSYVKKLRIQMGGADSVILTFDDWLAWTLLCLIEAGVALFDWPAPRWSHYILKLREKGSVIAAVLTQHGGPYASRRGRYVLIIDREDAA